MLQASCLAHEGPRSRGDPEGGAGFGVLRPRLVTADSGGSGIARRVLRPGREEFSLSSFGGDAGAESMRSRRLKIAKVERRKARAPLARCSPRLASAAQLAPPALRRPSSGEAARKSQKPGRRRAAGTKGFVAMARRIPIRGHPDRDENRRVRISDEVGRGVRSTRPPVRLAVEVLLRPAIVSTAMCLHDTCRPRAVEFFS
jgi:hypothetical protein